MSFFSKASWFKVRGGNFVDAPGGTVIIQQSSTGSQAPGSGFEKLTIVALEQALRDSSAWERPRCLEDTRVEHLRNLKAWGEGEWKSQQARIFWMDGPAGVGKSAIAQTWADGLDEKLAAAFFFSRANRWNQAEKFWPTISYQLSTKYPSFRQAVDAAIIRDPLVLSSSKSIDGQFQDLIVKPLHASSSMDRKTLTNAIIVIDGLDECSSEDAQRLIINVVAASAAIGTTSFLWAFFTRPEPHIVSAFAAGHAPKVCWHLTLPVQSPDSENDIRTFLRDAFQMIQAKDPFLDASWPSEEDFNQLVKQCDGLFAYSTNAIRFIDVGPGLTQHPGPEERLQALLDLAKASRTPLSKLDQLYLLIMSQIAKETLPTTLLILCANQYLNLYFCSIPHLSALFGFSPSALTSALRALHSVVEITGKPHPSLKYYHASFTDFLTIPERSTSEYCINTRNVFIRLYNTCLDAAIRPLPAFYGEYGFPVKIKNDEDKKITAYRIALATLLCLPETMVSLQIEILNQPELLRKLELINWVPAAEHFNFGFSGQQIESFIGQIPREWRRKIIYPFPELQLSTLGSQATGSRLQAERQGYVLGTGANRAWLKPERNRDYRFKPYPEMSTT